MFVTFDVPGDGSAITVDAQGLGRFERAGGAWEPTASELQAFVGTYHSTELDTEYELALDQMLHPEKYVPESSVDPSLEAERMSQFTQE